MYLPGDTVLIRRGIKKDKFAVVQKVHLFGLNTTRFDVLVEDGVFCRYSPQSLSRWIAPTEQEIAIARDGLISLLVDLS